MKTNQYNIQGLNNSQVLEARKTHGMNQLEFKKENAYLTSFLNLVKDPMIILLLVASIIYFISGKTADGFFLSSAIILISLISSFQSARSKNALDKLKNFTQPKCKVIRNGEVELITTADVVLGDSLLLEEGVGIAADGIIVHSNDFSVNESILTGESLAVIKDKNEPQNTVFHCTTVASGLAIITVTAIGNKTKLGIIGKSLESIVEEKTPLEKQINNFVKKMVIAGAIIFVIVWLINFLHSLDIIDSLLKSLTLAMSIIPEEIPFALASYMALGAWRLMKVGIVVKQMKTVETLGSATVICTDKTGTLTENNMSLAKIFVLETNAILDIKDTLNEAEQYLLRTAMWASETLPFDPMEIALHDAYATAISVDERNQYKLVHEYPLSGTPPMMTHVFENQEGKKIIAAKGAPEALIEIAQFSNGQKTQIETALHTLSAEGYRLLAVAEANFEGNAYPEKQQDFKFVIKGIVAFYDPPKKNIHSVLESFYKAGIKVKIITGDNAATTTSIAKQVGFKGFEKNITGEELMKLENNELKKAVSEINIFTRMFPEAKLKIINALKAQHEIVAMTGDGVNDGPALKAAHIGIAMGKKGTEIAKQAASLILINDDLSKMVNAVAMGRKIYTNLKKAVSFIISIHIPIILTVFIPLALGWIYPNIFSPIHIIFLELIMGPTCSIIYENEPIEKNAMSQQPRKYTSTFFNWKELTISILQGLVITAGTLITYQFSVHSGYNEATTRTMVFVTLVTANIILTLVNRSFYYSIFTTMFYKNNFIALIIGITIILTMSMLYFAPITEFFLFQTPNLFQLAFSVAVGFVFVIWFEGVKLIKRLRSNK